MRVMVLFGRKSLKGDPRIGAIYRKRLGHTLTVGELAQHLSRFDADMPVTIGAPQGDWWFNIDGASDPIETGEASVILFAADDFDTRQF